MDTAKTREPLTDDEREKFEGYAAEIFSRMGMEPATPGTRETPRRWVTALWDMTEGYDGDPKLSTLFPVECPTCPEAEKTHVVEGPIHFTGLCEHRVLPIRGSGWGIPGGKQAHRDLETDADRAALLETLHKPGAPAADPSK